MLLSAKRSAETKAHMIASKWVQLHKQQLLWVSCCFSYWWSFNFRTWIYINNRFIPSTDVMRDGELRWLGSNETQHPSQWSGHIYVYKYAAVGGRRCSGVSSGTCLSSWLKWANKDVLKQTFDMQTQWKWVSQVEKTNRQSVLFSFTVNIQVNICNTKKKLQKNKIKSALTNKWWEKWSFFNSDLLVRPIILVSSHGITPVWALHSSTGWGWSHLL